MSGGASVVGSGECGGESKEGVAGSGAARHLGGEASGPGIASIASRSDAIRGNMYAQNIPKT